MRSLFLRLFVAFWLTALISGLIFAAVAYTLRPDRNGAPSVPPQLGFATPPGLHAPPPDPPPHGMPHGPPPGGIFLRGIGVHLVIYLVVAGLICYLLAWRLTAPLRALRGAAQSLASGDLSARTGMGSSLKGDEIADLGRDFDRMAERIEGLMAAQKQLVRDISHELRSPLARLGVALELARKHAGSGAEPALERIEQETYRLNGMIGELLTLSLLEGGDKVAGYEQFDLSRLVSEIVDDCNFEAGADGLRVELSVSRSV